MKRIETKLWKDGKGRAVTFSYDDGRIEDKRLVELFNKYGLKGTFHLCNPGFLASCGYPDEPLVDPDEYASLYEGHEISCHMEHHPFPRWMPAAAVREEIMNNRRFLESRCNYPVRGMSYPFASFSGDVIRECRAVGMEYSRTVSDTYSFGLPEDFMVWNPTCHHSAASQELIDRFFEPMNYDFQRLLYIWGHSYEFNTEEKWNHIENICRAVSGRDDVWYATNIEIVDYINALRALRFSADCSTVYNPSAIPVWILVDSETVMIASGETKEI